MKTSKELQLAVVGIGAFGIKYITALKNMSGVDVTWVSCRTEDTCRQVARDQQVARWATDYREICRDPRVDAVVVCTPESAHREITLAALESGKHVIVEKPLATSADDCRAMSQAAAASGKLLMVAHLLRFDSRYAQLKQRLPQIAPVRNVYAYRNFDRRLFELYSRTHSFIENAIHDLDLMLWYVDSRVRRAHGFCRNTQGRPNPDINWGVLEFENGALGVLQTSWMYPRQKHEDLQWNAGIQVGGDHGVLEAANDRQGFQAHTDTTGLLLLDQTGWAEIHGEQRGAFGAMLRHMAACLRGEAAYVGATAAEATEAVRVAHLLVEDSRRPERNP